MNNTNNKKHYGGNNNYHHNNFGTHRKSKEEYEAEKAKQIALQSVSLNIIDDSAKFMNDFLKNGTGYKITMREILSYLNDTCGYDIDQTKVISQFNYLMMDLANARKNTHISGDRLNIRVLYIEERMKTSFKKELHDRAREIVKKYDTLFHWNDESTGDNYTTLPERK